MKITKLGHCALLIEDEGTRLLTDPGSFTREAQEKLTNIHGVIFTHEHQDHFHLDSLRIILKNNPDAAVVCNITVAALLDTEGITHTLVQHGGTAQVGSILLEGFGTDHATIHSSFPLMSNTGFFVQGRLWYPGDAFFNPGKKPEILALPVSAPWMKLSEAIDYALTLKPDHVFPVHDFILSDAGLAVTYRMTDTILSQNNVTFHPIEIGKEYTF